MNELLQMESLRWLAGGAPAALLSEHRQRSSSVIPEAIANDSAQSHAGANYGC
jgi:hypothetical protein